MPNARWPHAMTVAAALLAAAVAGRSPSAKTYGFKHVRLADRLLASVTAPNRFGGMAVHTDGDKIESFFYDLLNDRSAALPAPQNGDIFPVDINAERIILADRREEQTSRTNAVRLVARFDEVGGRFELADLRTEVFPTPATAHSRGVGITDDGWCGVNVDGDGHVFAFLWRGEDSLGLNPGGGGSQLECLSDCGGGGSVLLPGSPHWKPFSFLFNANREGIRPVKVLPLPSWAVEGHVQVVTPAGAYGSAGSGGRLALCAWPGNGPPREIRYPEGYVSGLFRDGVPGGPLVAALWAADGTRHAFLYHPRTGSWVDLQRFAPAGLRITDVGGMSGDGHISVHGETDEPTPHPFIALLTPKQSS